MTQAAICVLELKRSLPRMCSTWLPAVRVQITSRVGASRVTSAGRVQV